MLVGGGSMPPADQEEEGGKSCVKFWCEVAWFRAGFRATLCAQLLQLERGGEDGAVLRPCHVSA